MNVAAPGYKCLQSRLFIIGSEITELDYIEKFIWNIKLESWK